MVHFYIYFSFQVTHFQERYLYINKTTLTRRISTYLK